MTTKLTKAYITAQHRLQDVVARREAGQGALEYVGILVVVMIVFAAVWTAVDGQKETIGTKVTDLITDFLNGV